MSHGIRHLPQLCILELHTWNADNKLRMMQMSAVDSLIEWNLQTGGPQPPQTAPATERLPQVPRTLTRPL